MRRVRRFDEMSSPGVTEDLVAPPSGCLVAAAAAVVLESVDEDLSLHRVTCLVIFANDKQVACTIRLLYLSIINRHVCLGLQLLPM